MKMTLSLLMFFISMNTFAAGYIHFSNNKIYSKGSSDSKDAQHYLYVNSENKVYGSSTKKPTTRSVCKDSYCNTILGSITASIKSYKNYNSTVSVSCTTKNSHTFNAVSMQVLRNKNSKNPIILGVSPCLINQSCNGGSCNNNSSSARWCYKKCSTS